MENLSKQDQVFVKEVAIHGNQTEAAKKAYDIKDPNYAGVKAHRLLRNDKILGAVDDVKKTIAERLEDDMLLGIHKSLLHSRRLDHMVFPLGPKDDVKEPQANLSPEIKTVMEAQKELERTKLSDRDIEQLLKDAGCVLRKIVHGQTARHVYFWAPDNMARDKALDKAYKLKGTYAPEKSVNLNLNEVIASEELIELANRLNEAARSHTGPSISGDGTDSNPVDAEAQN